MPTTDSYRKAIRRTLARFAGVAPVASEVAEAAVCTWNLMAAQLIPVIGVMGADVLFRRSLHLTSTTFPWLAIVGDHGNRDALLESFKARLAGRETDTATEVSCILLVTVVELLNNLIGVSLTERLLDPIWVAASPASEQETIS